MQCSLPKLNVIQLILKVENSQWANSQWEKSGWNIRKNANTIGDKERTNSDSSQCYGILTICASTLGMIISLWTRLIVMNDEKSCFSWPYKGQCHALVF